MIGLIRLKLRYYFLIINDNFQKKKLWKQFTEIITFHLDLERILNHFKENDSELSSAILSQINDKGLMV